MTLNQLVQFMDAAYPERKGRLIVNLSTCARIFANHNDQKMRAFLKERCVATYGVGKKAEFNVIEVWEELEKTKNTHRWDEEDD